MSKIADKVYMVLKRESNVTFDAYINIGMEFGMSEIVSGTFVSYHSYDESEMIYALFDIDDGRKTSVWMHYFRTLGTKMYYMWSCRNEARRICWTFCLRSSRLKMQSAYVSNRG